MKLSFIFTDEPYLKGLPKENIFRTHFEFPNEALQLPDCEARLLSIAETVGQLTDATLHVTCKEIGWKEKLIKRGRKPEIYSDYLRNTNDVIVIVFKRFVASGASSSTNVIKIYAPIQHSFSLQKVRTKGKPSIGNQKWLIDDRKKNDTTASYFNLVNSIRDTTIPLLKAQELSQSNMKWYYLGFHPQWHEDSLRQLRNKQRKPIYFGEEKARREAKELAKKSPQVQKGRVYFVQQGENGAIKIGYSTTPEKRLQSLKTANPLPLRLLKVIEGGKNLEKELHQRFAALHIGGEWFHAHPDLLLYIEQLPTTNNQSPKANNE